MLIPMINRLDLISGLPKGGRGAEVGVLNGEFSTELWNRCQPLEMNLIDTWGPSQNPKLVLDPAYFNMEQAEGSLKNVFGRFPQQIDNGTVKLYRMFSNEAASLFPDEYLDWIYIDADHTYRGAEQDLRLYDSKVKKNGFILGHDYTNNYMGVSGEFGVIEAVNEFVKKNNYHLLAVTMSEGYPSYLISKIYDVEADNLLGYIINNSDFTIEVNNFEEFKYNHDIFYGNGKERIIVKIGR